MNLAVILLLQWILTTESQLTIDEATVQLEECPKGDHIVKGYYIGVGTKATCTCRKKSMEGFDLPPGYVQWYFENETEAATKDSNTSTLEFVGQKGRPYAKYFCVYRNESDSPVGRGISYTATVFYGPDSMALKRLDTNSTSGDFDKCPEKNISYQCDIRVIDVSPEPIFVFHTIDGDHDMIFLDRPINNTYDSSDNFTFVYEFVPATSGKLEIGCDVRNSLFPENKEGQKEMSATLNIREPPSAPPMITVTAKNSHTVEGITYVEEDSDIGMTCKVSGGVPEVSKVLLQCDDGKSNNVPGTSSALDFTATKSVSRRNCSCSAQHVTGCYDLRMDTILENIVVLKILDFTVNDERNFVEYERGTTIHISCTAEGNPIPNLSLVRFSDPSTVIQSQVGTTLTRTLGNVQCTSSDRYFCLATNKISPRIQSSINVGIKCVLELQNPDSEWKKYQSAIGKDIVIQVAILGYPQPEPTKYRLAINEGTVLKEVNDSSKYSYSYESQSKDINIPAHIGAVTLTIKTVDKTDLVKYTLTIGNGVGKDLLYHFELEESPEDYTLAIVLGTVGGALLVIIIIVVVIFVIRRRRRAATLGTSPQQQREPGDDLVPRAIHLGKMRPNYQLPHLPSINDYEDPDQSDSGYEGISSGSSGYIKPVEEIYDTATESSCDDPSVDQLFETHPPTFGTNATNLAPSAHYRNSSPQQDYTPDHHDC